MPNWLFDISVNISTDYYFCFLTVWNASWKARTRWKEEGKRSVLKEVLKGNAIPFLCNYFTKILLHLLLIPIVSFDILLAWLYWQVSQRYYKNHWSCGKGFCRKGFVWGGCQTLWFSQGTCALILHRYFFYKGSILPTCLCVDMNLPISS